MDRDLSVTQSLVGALLLAVVLATLHLTAPRIRRLPLVPERATGSFAGGLAVAYVFLHLLPELAEGNQSIGDALDDVVQPTPLLDLAVFLVALGGFTVFYGLERLADRRTPRVGTGGDEPQADRGGGAGGLYALHLGAFLVYNVLITYTMALRLRTGVAFALLFTVAMGLHFVLTDRGLQEHYPRHFDRRGRLALAAALAAGWVASALFAPSSTVLVALLTALLGGSILLNVFKEEIPSDRNASFGWFVTGLTVYAALLAAVTAAAG